MSTPSPRRNWIVTLADGCSAKSAAETFNAIAQRNDCTKDVSINHVLETIGIVSLNCTDDFISKISSLPEVKETAAEETVHTQKNKKPSI